MITEAELIWMHDIAPELTWHPAKVSGRNQLERIQTLETLIKKEIRRAKLIAIKFHSINPRFSLIASPVPCAILQRLEGFKMCTTYEQHFDMELIGTCCNTDMYRYLNVSNLPDFILLVSDCKQYVTKIAVQGLSIHTTESYDAYRCMMY